MAAASQELRVHLAEVAELLHVAHAGLAERLNRLVDVCRDGGGGCTSLLLNASRDA